MIYCKDCVMFTRGVKKKDEDCCDATQRLIKEYQNKMAIQKKEYERNTHLLYGDISELKRRLADADSTIRKASKHVAPTVSSELYAYCERWPEPVGEA